MEPLKVAGVVVNGDTEIDDLVFAAEFAKVQAPQMDLPVEIKRRILRGNDDSDNESVDEELEEMKRQCEPISYNKEKSLLDDILGTHQFVAMDDSDGEGNHQSENNKGVTLPQFPEAVPLPESFPPQEPILPVGRLMHALEGVICVQADPAFGVFDLGSVFATLERKVLGYVIDAFGPVTSPIYMIQCDSAPLLQSLAPQQMIFAVMACSTFVMEPGQSKPQQYLQAPHEDEPEI